MKQKFYQTNPFLAAAQAMWQRGEDGKVIAKDLAEAFRTIVTEGIGQHNIEAHQKELKKLTDSMDFS